MSTKKAFHEYLEIQRLRNGDWFDGKMVSVYFDLRIGPITIRDVRFLWATNSLQFRSARIRIKPAYVSKVVGLLKKEIDKASNSG